MTQPPYGGAQPPDGQPPREDPVEDSPQGWAAPASASYPPPVDPYAAPTSGQPATPYGQPHTPPAANPFPAASTAPYPPPGQPVSGQPYLAQPYPGQPVSGQPYPGHPGYPPVQPGYPSHGAPQPKKRRGLLIASIVLAVVLVLCGGGAVTAFLLLRNAETGEGAAEPVAAVNGFLKAVYTDQDAKKAAALVCSEARKESEIAKKIQEIKGYATTYKNPRFRWAEPKVEDQNAERAIVSTKLTMMTGDEKTSEQQLKFTVVNKTGWWVCEVRG